MPEYFDPTTDLALQAQKKAAARRRMRIIVVVLFVSVIARLIIKDPVKQKAADLSKADIRYLPGVLANLTPEQRARLSPEMLANLKAADQRAVSESLFAQKPEFVPAYIPAEAPAPIQEDIEAYQEEIFRYTEKRKKIEELHKEETVDRTKTMLVLFKRGGHLKAEKTMDQKGRVRIQMDRTMHFKVPKRLVRSVSPNALNWEEPVPKGFVKIKPARGVTLVVQKNTAKRIKNKKKKYEI